MFSLSPSSSIHSQDPLEFRLSELKKHFVVGDHVKVIAGRHEGETGLVVRIEANLAVLLSDLTLQEVYCCTYMYIYYASRDSSHNITLYS